MRYGFTCDHPFFDGENWGRKSCSSTIRPACSCQKCHLRRNLEEKNVNVRQARRAIFDNLNSRRIGVGPIKGGVQVGGRTIEYRGQRFPDGRMNIGRATAD